MFGHRSSKWPASVLILLCAGGYCLAAEPTADPREARPQPPTPEMFVPARSAPAGGTFDITAKFRLAEKVKLYRDKLRFTWSKLEGAEFKEAIFPEPKTVAEPFAVGPGKLIQVYYGQVDAVARLKVTAMPGEQVRVAGKLHHQACTDVLCFAPQETEINVEFVAGAQTAGDAGSTLAGAPGGEQGGMLWQIVIAFWWGVLLSLTPCVYPMIPVTAAVIGARRQAGLLSALGASLVYVLGLSIVYALAGLLVATLGSAVSTFLQSPYVLIPIAGIFVALAVVMFAGLNFAAPTGLASKLQGALAGKTGVLTTFALGAVSGLIVGPCVTAPLAGILLFIAKSGQAWLGFWMLFALGWGMGVPLIVFGTATGLMPRAGEWMGWIKRLLGFVLLWAALFFLRSIIGEVAYRITFGVLLVAAAVYLGGFDRLTRESGFGDRLKKVLGVIAVMYAAFLFISGFTDRPVVPGTAPTDGPTSGRIETLFQPGTQADVERAVAAGRPVVLDFYASWCTICHALDARVYSKPEAIAAAEGIAAFKIDVDTEKALAKKYNVFGPPAVIFIEPGGKVRKDLSFVGAKITVAEFRRKLEALRP